MKNVNEMSLWDALENIADMMIEEGWTSDEIDTAAKTLRHIKSDLFEVERYDAASDLSKAAGDSAWILDKVAMIVAERGGDHQPYDEKLRDLAWDIEEMWTGCGIARIDEGHQKFTSWVDYYEFTDECERYGLCEIEAFVNWEEEEYDIDGILSEVTFVDPVTGDRYWEPEFVDDEDALFEVCMRYHKDDEKDDDAENLVAELTENTMSREWNDNKREQLLVEFNDPKFENEGIDWEIDDLVDGWGHEKKLEDMIAEITEKDPGDWEAEFALDRMVNIGVEYLRVAEMDDRRKNKHDMFKSWAQALGCNIVTCELTDRDPGGKGVIEYADGRIAGIDVSVTYRLYENK